MDNETLHLTDAHSRSALVLSPHEATEMARRDQGGWFIAGRNEKYMVGKFTPKGEWQVISYLNQPIIFSSVELAHAYLREIGIEWPCRLIGQA